MIADQSLQEVIDKARAKIRKTWRKKSPSPKAKALTVAGIAGICWELENEARSYGTTKSSTSKPFKSIHKDTREYYYKRLPAYRKLTELQKAFMVHEYILTTPGIVPVSLTFNLAPKTETTVGGSSSLDYPRDQITKVFKTVLNGHAILFWLVEEKRPRRHFHGAAGIPQAIANQQTYDALEKAIANLPLVKKREEEGGNKKSYVSLTYKRKGSDKEWPVDSGAIFYALKEYKKHDPNRLAISSNLRGSAGNRYKNTLRQLKQQDK